MRSVFHSVRTMTLLLCAGCASYRVLPPPMAPGTAVSLEAETTRLWVFHGSTDARVDRVFVNPADARDVLVTTWQPEAGVSASRDGGQSWKYTPLRVENAPPLGTVLFDGDALLAISGDALLRSTDGGRTFAATPVQGPVQALVSASGRVYAAGGQLFVSADHGATWESFALPARGLRSLAADPERRGVLFASFAGLPAPFRAVALIEQSSPEAVDAFTLLDAPVSRPRFGRGAKAWTSIDGGRTWRETSLELDAQLVALPGKLYAVATDPMLVGAGLVRRNPALASLVGAQLRGLRPDAQAVRAACELVGRDRLLAGELDAAPIFVSTDDGATWKHGDDAPRVELRLAIEAQRAARPPAPPAPEQRGPGQRQRGMRDLAQSRGGRRGGGRPQRPPEQQQASTGAAFILDPQQLLARAAFDAPLTGVSRAGDGTLWAYVPTDALWSRLVDGIVRATEGAGELAGLPDWAVSEAMTPGSFALLRSADGGASWTELPLPEDPSPPQSPGLVLAPARLAAAPDELWLVFAGRDRRAKTWQRVMRVRP